MSSFANLKASRAGRRQARVTPNVLREPEPEITASTISKNDDEATSIATKTETLGNILQCKDKTSETVDKEVSKGSHDNIASIEVKDSLSYPDFPHDVVRICKTKAAGRGVYVKSGSLVKKGVYSILRSSCRV